MTYVDFDGLPSRRRGTIYAVKQGFAADWHNTLNSDFPKWYKSQLDPVKGLKTDLHLYNYDIPIQGELVDTNNQPLAGVRILVESVHVPRNYDLDDYLKTVTSPHAFLLSIDAEQGLSPPIWIPGYTTETKTDADGRFTIAGFGPDWVLRLQASSPTIATTSFSVMTRNAPDVTDFKDTSGASDDRVIHGAQFKKQIKPGLSVKGRVIDRETKQPLAGMWVGPLSNVLNSFSRERYPYTTDADGRFEITGYDPEFYAKHADYKNTFVAASAPGMNYDQAWGDARPGDEIVLECQRRIPFRLKVVNEAGEPVEASVTSIDIQANSNVIHDEMIWPQCHAGRNADGTYSGFVLPGPGAVLVSAAGNYQSARVDPKAFFAPGKTDWTEKEQTSAYGTLDFLITNNGRYLGTLYRGWTVSQPNYQAIVLVNPAKDSGPLELTATLVKQKTRMIHLVDPEGKPLRGATAKVYKTIGNHLESLIRGSSFELTDLRPDIDQPLNFWDQERKLMGFLKIRGDSSEPVTVRLLPWGEVTMRVVDQSGQPYSHQGVLDNPDDPQGSHKTFEIDEPGGVLRLAGLMPGHSYTADGFWQGMKGRVATKVFEKLILKPGEVRDLGEIRVQPPDSK